MENENLPGPIREQLPTESGYSEEEQAKIVEGSLTDIKQLKKRKPLVIVDRQVKIIAAYDQTHQKIMGLLAELKQIVGNPRHQEKVIEEMKSLRTLQDELLQCLLLEQRGELSEDTTSQEAWNLIK